MTPQLSATQQAPKPASKRGTEAPQWFLDHDQWVCEKLDNLLDIQREMVEVARECNDLLKEYLMQTQN